MSAIAAAPSARRIAWLRRRRAVARAWRDYRGHLPGMVGLVVLVLVVAMALLAPLLADEAGLKAINSTGNPTWASPSEFGPLGHRRARPRRDDAVHLGIARSACSWGSPRRSSRW